MTSETKRLSLMDIESLIELPKSFFVKGENNIRFTYRYNGKTHYIALTSRPEVAQFLKLNRFIKTYAVIGDRVEMYDASIVTTTGRRGEPVLTQILVKKAWQEIDFTQYEIVRFAAENEWNKTYGKVIRGVFHITRAIKRAI